MGDKNLDDECHDISTPFLTKDGKSYSNFDDYVSKHTKYCYQYGGWRKDGSTYKQEWQWVGARGGVYHIYNIKCDKYGQNVWYKAK